MARHGHSFGRCGRAFSTVKVVAALPAFIMMTWFGVEIALAVRAMGQARAAADSIAVAAAARARDGHQIARADALAAAAASRGPNGPVSVTIGDGPAGGQDVEFGDWDEVTRSFVPNPSGGDAVRARVRFASDHPNGTASPVLSGLFGASPLAIERTSVAIHVRARHTTSLLLDAASGVVLSIGGAAIVDLDGGISVRSSGTGCVVVGADASLSASVVRAAGSVDAGSVSQVDGTVIDGFDVPPDPFAGLVMTPIDVTSAIAIDHDDLSVTEVEPGVHQGIEIAGGSVVLLPGLHQFSGAIVVRGTGSLVLQDATVQLDTAASLSIAGQGSVTGTPSTAGDWAGAAFLQSNSTEPWILGGDAQMDVAGMVYAPQSSITVQSEARVKLGSAILGSLTCTDSAVVEFTSDIDELKGVAVPGRARLVR